MIGLTEPPDETTANWFFGTLLAVMSYSLLMFVGIWRSAGSYPGPEMWGVAAKGSVLFGVTLYLIMIFALLKPI
jgi:hypothetical protein